MSDLFDGSERTPDAVKRLPVGEAYADGSSRRVPAHLDDTADDGRVDLVDSSDGRVLTSVPIATIRCERRLGSFPTAIRFPSGWRFLSPDHDKLCAVFGSERFGRLHQWEAVRPRSILLAALALAAGIVVCRWGIAALVAVAVAFTPDSVPTAIDRVNLATNPIFRFPSRLSENDRLRVQEVLNRLTQVAPAARFGNYRLVFRRIPDVGPNAAALPGGTIVMTDDLVRSFPDPDTIAGVLGHEIAHIAEEHALKKRYGSVGTYLLVQFAVGNAGPVLEDFLRPVGGYFLSLAYSRAHERQADRIGVKLVAEAGYNPVGLARFLERRHTSDVHVPVWISTHPAPVERISWILSFAREFGHNIDRDILQNHLQNY